MEGELGWRRALVKRSGMVGYKQVGGGSLRRCR